MKNIKDIFEGILKEPAVRPQSEEKQSIAPAQEKPKVEEYTFKVAEVSHHLDEIKKYLVDENSDYSMGRKAIVDLGLAETMIYRYDGYSTNVAFVPEPDNPHNRDALKVVVDGIFIGYVPEKNIKEVKNLLDKDGLQTECSFTGGEYKIVHNEGDFYRLKTGKDQVVANITLS